MSATVRKWGNSLAVRIPKVHAEELGLEDGSVVRVSVEAGRLIVQREAETRYDLVALLRNVTPRNLHRGVETGPPVGREVW